MKLPKHEWSILNHLQTGYGYYADMMYKWRLQDSPLFDSGNEKQTLSHIIIIECQLRKFN